ncbi:ABC-type antimicrobial peptide transport system, permease component [Marinobacterium lacunae]|uniref:ABC-type antimicrobial peptide transport system, permease component n=1 Tax=Marinobacterium lacunae TaxID=1232683 RepID=A0A081FXX5_9GAMM|nr:ABC transporter permease [Marinobacterium lacunae]KEA63380.1 ABC-type antimicrobial peptide transport system, permease component [Marinobacterium lacunae]
MMIDLLWKSLKNRRGTALLCVLTIAFSVALLAGVEKVRQDMREGFFNTVSETDLIVGARTGQIELLLYSVFHLGSATNNIRWSSYQRITNDSAVQWTIPVSLGDSHKGFRVVGTSASFFEHFRFGRDKSLSMSTGRSFNAVHEVTLGAKVAKTLGYKVGDQVIIAHGLGSTSFSQHKDQPFTVVGILAPTGTPVDQSLLVSLESISAIHIGWRAGVPMPGFKADADKLATMDLTPKEITAFMVGLKTKTQVFQMQRAINRYSKEPLMAILPGVALQELWQVLGGVEKAMLLVSACVVLAGLTGMLGVLLTGMQQRRRELALLRAIGASPFYLLRLVIAEACILTATGIAAGLALLWGTLAAIQSIVQEGLGLYLTFGWPTGLGEILTAVLIAGTLAGTLPAWKAWRYTLADGLTPKI